MTEYNTATLAITTANATRASGPGISRPRGRPPGQLRPARVTRPRRHLPYLSDRPACGRTGFRDMFPGFRRAPGDRLQRGGGPAGRRRQAIADRQPQVVRRPDPLGDDCCLGELTPGRVDLGDEVGQPDGPAGQLLPNTANGR